MTSRNPQLEGDLPPVSWSEWKEPERKVAAESQQKWRQSVRPVTMKQQAGVDIDKIWRRQELLWYRRRGEAPYEIKEYLHLGSEAGLSDAKQF